MITTRLFIPDKWVGPKLKARHLDKSLLAIKPKKTSVLVKTKRNLQRKEGRGTVGVAYSNGRHTIYVCPSTEREDIAHEFGHAAYGSVRRFPHSAHDHIKREIAANLWAEKNWAIPNKIKTGTYKERRRWIASVAGQCAEELSLEPMLAVKAVQKDMRYFGMKPLTKDEYQYVVRETKSWCKHVPNPKWTLKNVTGRWYK